MRKLLHIAAALCCAITAYAVPVTPATIPHVTFVNGSGGPCAGCKLSTFTAGTTTPLATYTDSSGTSVNTNPITLDAAGGANIWLGRNSYKFILKDALGNTIWSVDNVNAANLFPCSPTGTIQIANAGLNGLSCDANITIDTINHTLKVGTLGPNYVTIGALGTPTSWFFDTTSPATALASLGSTAISGPHFPGQIIASNASGSYAVQPQVFYAQPGDTIASIETQCSSACTYVVTSPQTITLTGNHTLSSTVALQFLAGGVWTVNGAFTLTIGSGIVSGPPTTHFAGTSTVTGLFTVEPEWFGGTNSTAMTKALAGCASTGCDYQLQAATYQSPWTSTAIGRAHVRLLGAAEGDYSGDNTHVVGGTIIQGAVLANADYFEASNLCVDVGATFIGGGSAQDGLVLDNPGQVIGAPQWQNPNIHDVCVLGSSAGAAVHAMLIENTNNAKLTNIRTRFNTDGLVVKGTKAVISGYVGSGHNTAALYIKGDTFAPTAYVAVSNVHVSGVASGDTVGVVLDGGTQAIGAITMNGITGDHLSIGFIVNGSTTIISDVTIQSMILDTMTQTGFKVLNAVQRLKLDNAVINNAGDYGVSFGGGNVNYSTVSNVQVTNAAIDSFVADGQYNQFTNDYSRNAGGYGLHLQGTAPMSMWACDFSSHGDTGAPTHADAGGVFFPCISPGGVAFGALAISALPVASTVTVGTTMVVTDATSFTPGTCTGGGSDTMLAVSNGTAWTCH